MRTSAARRRSLWRTGPTALRKTRHAGLEVRKGSGIRRVSVFVRLQYAAWDNEPLDGGMREQWGFWREFVLCRYVDELLRCQLASREGRPTRAIEQQWAHALHSREFLIRFISAQPDYNSPRSPVIFNSWYRQGMVPGASDWSGPQNVASSPRCIPYANFFARTLRNKDGPPRRDEALRL